MKLFIMGLFALVLTSGAAHAGWNITQQDDGSTVWTDDNGKTVPVGDSGFTLEVTDISTASSAYAVVHREGKVKKVYVITDGPTTGTAGLTFYTGTGGAGTFTSISAPSTGTVHTSIVAGTGGVLYTFTPADSAVDISQGAIFAVETNGSSTNTVAATITVIIE